MSKIDYSGVSEDIFYKIIYPLLAEELLLGNDYEKFAELCAGKFTLSPYQWECILSHWELKESILGH